MTLEDGQLFTLTADEVEGTKDKVSVTYNRLYEDLYAVSLSYPFFSYVRRKLRGKSYTARRSFPPASSVSTHLHCPLTVYTLSAKYGAPAYSSRLPASAFVELT